MLALFRVRNINFFKILKRKEERQDKTKEMNNSKKMRKRRKEINCFVYVWKSREKEKRKENKVFLFPLFGLQQKRK